MGLPVVLQTIWWAIVSKVRYSVRCRKFPE